MPSAYLRFAAGLSMLLGALGCAPELAHEVARFERGLDEELAAALQPRAERGLEAACHRAPILWMHFIADGSHWRLLSVDERGEVGVWTKRGLEQTWSLREDELEWVRRVETRQRLSEDAHWLRARAKVPRPFAESHAAPPFAIEPRDAAHDIAPRNDRRWVGVHDHPPWSRRISASGSWYAVGDGTGEIAVARVGTSRAAAMWVAPACEDLRVASLGDALELLVEGSELGEMDPIDAELALAETVIDEPELAWQEVHTMLSANQRWVAVAGETGWVVRDRIGGRTRRVETRSDAHVAFAAVSRRGTLARAGWAGARGFVDLHPFAAEPMTHELPVSPVAVVFVPSEADADDTLVIGIPATWEAFTPRDLRLLRLDPGGVPAAHPIAGFDTIDRVLGPMPAATPTLVVAGDGVLGIERLTDGAVLRVVVHGRRLSLIWLDRNGRHRCRHDGAEDDHVPSRADRIADARVLVDAFLSGRDCPRS